MVKNLLVPSTRRIHLPPRRRIRLAAQAMALAALLGLGSLLSGPCPAYAQAPSASASTASPGTPAGSAADAAQVSPEEKAAKEQAAREEAGVRFQRGLAFYGDGDFALALIEFDRAYLLVPDYRVLYNIGQVSIQLSRFAGARLALEQYLAEGGAAIPEERVTAVNRDLRMLGDRTAFLELTSTPVGAEVLIDDRSHGETPLASALLLDAGEHQVVVRKKGFQPVTRQVVLAGAERLPMAVELVPTEEAQVVIVQKPDPVTTQKPVADKVERRGPDPAVFAWIGTGVLTAAAVTTGILGLDAKARYDAARLEPDSGDAMAAAASEAQAFFLACDILTVSAAVAFGTSLYLTLHKSKAPAASASAPPSSAFSRARFAAPTSKVELAVLPHFVHLRGTF
jgi:hypothetical protein